MEIRHAVHPSQASGFTADQLREHYLVDDLFGGDAVRAVYSHHDRMAVGGVAPEPGVSVALPAFEPLRSEYFCQRRELGVINVGSPGEVRVDGQAHRLDNKDGLYVPRGARDVSFSSGDEGRAKFYLVSTPAHASHPAAHIRFADVAGVRLGSPEGSNVRTLRKYIHADGVRSCQLVMGLTVLEPGSMWNTMPCHTHDRRTEVYLYTDLPDEHRVVHLLGRPDETRHMIVASDQAVISPSWSVHTGCGTHSYAFVWAMGGENQRFDDMDQIAIRDLR
ncbi:MAG: 5-dehydro-4-deoxy-D-glucuronate isomerase [Stackebrandtia sp.]